MLKTFNMFTCSSYKNFLIHEMDIRKPDKEHKMKMKQYTDNIKQTYNFNPLVISDSLFIQRHQHNKAISKFCYNPYKVIALKGSMVSV